MSSINVVNKPDGTGTRGSASGGTPIGGKIKGKRLMLNARRALRSLAVGETYGPGTSPRNSVATPKGSKRAEFNPFGVD